MSLLIFLIITTLSVSFLCSMLEATILSTTPSYIKSLYRVSQTKAKKLDKLKRDIDTTVSAILTLNTIANTMGATLIGAQAMSMYGHTYEALVSITLTLTILYFSEIVPKTIGATYWRQLAVPLSDVIVMMIKITSPLIFVSRLITKRIRKKDVVATTSRDEILAITELSEKSGSIGEVEGSLIENILKLKDIDTKDILTPRSVVFWVDENTKIQDILRQEDFYIYTRIPVYKDNPDNIIGFVLNHEIQKSYLDNNNGDMMIKEFIKPIFSVSESLHVLYLFNLFLKRREHIFIVYDRFKQTVGVVSLEDAIETLIGAEIVDEIDKVANLRELAKQKKIR